MRKLDLEAFNKNNGGENRMSERCFNEASSVMRFVNMSLIVVLIVFVVSFIIFYIGGRAS